MGQDKAILPWRGGTLLSHQVEVLESVVDRDSIFVSGQRAGFKSIPDGQIGCGPLEGLRSALEKLTSESLDSNMLVVPVDMPFLTQDELGLLIKSLGTADACIFEGMNLPMVVGNPNKVLQEINKLKRDSQMPKLSFRNLYERIEVIRIPGGSGARLVNINTPEDLDEAFSKTNASP
jgi:molybdopterin-guanine dinucleotide biosynthesis protein A